jgi:hypothetical protein
VEPVAAHQPPAVVVHLVAVNLDVGGHLGPHAAASICRAPSRTISSSSDDALLAEPLVALAELSS